VSGSVGFHTARAVFNANQAVGLNQSVASQAWTGVTLDNANLDTVGGHSTTVTPSRYICQVPGWYLAIGGVSYAVSSTAGSNTYIAGLRINGLNTHGSLFEGAKHPGGNSHGITPMVADLLSLNAGDYVELAAYQFSGATTTLTSSSGGSPVINYLPYLNLLWVASTRQQAVGLPVPSMSTWADGPVVPSATLNSQIRDGARFLIFPPVARLEYEGLTPLSQSQPNNAFTSISWDTATVDNYSGWGGTGSNPTRWVTPRTGRYLLIGQSAVGASFTGKRGVKFLINGATSVTGQHVSAVAAAGHGLGTSCLTVRLVKLNSGDYVEVQGLQNSGSASGLTYGTAHCKFVAVWMCS
jgi:hypothetical protein